MPSTRLKLMRAETPALPKEEEIPKKRFSDAVSKLGAEIESSFENIGKEFQARAIASGARGVIPKLHVKPPPIPMDKLEESMRAEAREKKQAERVGRRRESRIQSAEELEEGLPRLVRGAVSGMGLGTGSLSGLMKSVGLGRISPEGLVERGAKGLASLVRPKEEDPIAFKEEISEELEEGNMHSEKLVGHIEGLREELQVGFKELREAILFKPIKTTEIKEGILPDQIAKLEERIRERGEKGGRRDEGKGGMLDALLKKFGLENVTKVVKTASGFLNTAFLLAGKGMTKLGQAGMSAAGFVVQSVKSVGGTAVQAARPLIGSAVSGAGRLATMAGTSLMGTSGLGGAGLAATPLASIAALGGVGLAGGAVAHLAIKTATKNLESKAAREQGEVELAVGKKSALKAAIEKGDVEFVRRVSMQLNYTPGARRAAIGQATENKRKMEGGEEASEKAMIRGVTQEAPVPGVMKGRETAVPTEAYTEIQKRKTEERTKLAESPSKAAQQVLLPVTNVAKRSNPVLQSVDDLGVAMLNSSLFS